MEVERRPTYAIDRKQQLFEIELIILKISLSSSFMISSSLTQLTAAFSVLLAAITHFTLAFLSTTNIYNKLHSPENSGSGWENLLLAQN